jgi:integrase
MPRGAAVIEYRGKRGTTWRVKFIDSTGKQCTETLGREDEGWTRKKAEAELRERLVRVERKGWRKPAPLTFETYAERWFEAGEARRGWKPATVKLYVSVHRRLIDAFGPMRLAEIRPRHVAAYVTEATDGGLAPATVGRILSVLHALFKTAVREELIDSNPAEGVERPKVQPRRWRILEPDEVRRVAQAFTNEQDRAVFMTLILTGVRRSELQALRWGDVDLLEGVLRVRRSKSEAGERAIALSPTLREVLSGHYQRTAFRGDGELVFCHPTRGSRMKAEAFGEALRAALTAAGVEADLRPFHDLRHASLTNGAAAGESPIALMTRAGHTNMATTRLYLHLAGTVFQAEAERLEQRLLGSAVRGDDVARGDNFKNSGVETSTHLSAPEPTSSDPAPHQHAESDRADLL